MLLCSEFDDTNKTQASIEFHEKGRQPAKGIERSSVGDSLANYAWRRRSSLDILAPTASDITRLYPEALFFGCWPVCGDLPLARKASAAAAPSPTAAPPAATRRDAGGVPTQGRRRRAWPAARQNQTRVGKFISPSDRAACQPGLPSNHSPSLLLHPPQSLATLNRPLLPLPQVLFTENPKVDWVISQSHKPSTCLSVPRPLRGRPCAVDPSAGGPGIRRDRFRRDRL